MRTGNRYSGMFLFLFVTFFLLTACSTGDLNSFITDFLNRVSAGDQSITFSIERTIQAEMTQADSVATKVAQALQSQTKSPTTVVEAIATSGDAGNSTSLPTETASVESESVAATAELETTTTQSMTTTPEPTLELTLTITKTNTATIATRTATKTATPKITSDQPSQTSTKTQVQTLTPSKTLVKTNTPTKTATTTPKPTQTVPAPGITPTQTNLPTNPATNTPIPATATAIPSGCNWSANAGLESSLIALINAERSSRGLSTLSQNSALTSAARGHSQDMACNNFFSHTGSDGSSPFSRMIAAGYSYSRASENIYAGSGGYNSASSAFNAWMNSDGHRTNMLNPDIVHIGIGYAYVAGSDYGGYVTANFGAP